LPRGTRPDKLPLRFLRHSLSRVAVSWPSRHPGRRGILAVAASWPSRHLGRRGILAVAASWPSRHPEPSRASVAPRASVASRSVGNPGARRSNRPPHSGPPQQPSAPTPPSRRAPFEHTIRRLNTRARIRRER
jgi:hypothetical protein